jgi:DegV family protein with EDD domain
MPSPGSFAEIYQRLAVQGQEILSVHISSGLSNTLNAAQVGAKMLSGVLVEHVDTLTLSGGERFQVLAAALAARSGKSKEFILERLAKIRAATETIYTLETLDYLARGGRIGRVQALAGSLLKIKPVIFVDHKDGKYSTLSKERTVPKAIQTIADHLVKKYQKTGVWVAILHGQAEDYSIEITEKLSATLNIMKLDVMRISPVLGVHTGPGIVGAAVVPASLMQDLE